LWQKNAPIETYWEHSPLKYVTAARTPTIFLNGEYDPRIPMTQAVEMGRALKAQGVPSEVLIAPLEGHDWQRLDHQLSKMNIEMEWFEKYARNLPYTPEPLPTTNTSPPVSGP
jgi:dipeptidyl aminopeptidase/acylaminoacyl peptidase